MRAKQGRSVAVVMLMALVHSGCGERPRDVYERGLALERAAEKGPCRLVAGSGVMAKISGDQIAACLQQTERALEVYEQAARRGLDAPDFRSVHERAKERVERLSQMLTQVRKMERGQL